MGLHSEHVHRCLFIPEILDAICNELDQLSGRERNSSLGTIALTCRSFEETAMNYLWSQLFDIVPLVKCMPSDLLR
jgi:hypothetical protein